jgi:hypothetical protein
MATNVSNMHSTTAEQMGAESNIREKGWGAKAVLASQPPEMLLAGAQLGKVKITLGKSGRGQSPIVPVCKQHL